MKKLLGFLIVIVLLGACKMEPQEPTEPQELMEPQEPIWKTSWHSPNYKYNDIAPVVDIKLKTLSTGLEEDVLCEEKSIGRFGTSVIDRGYCKQQFYINDMEVSIESLLVNRYMKIIDIINAGYDIEFSEEMLKEPTPYNLIRETVFTDGREAYLYELDYGKYTESLICTEELQTFTTRVIINDIEYEYNYFGEFCNPEPYILEIRIPTTEEYSVHSFKGFEFTDAIDEGYITPDELEVLNYPEDYEKIEIKED